MLSWITLHYVINVNQQQTVFFVNINNLNTSTGLAGKMLDKLIENKAKDEARIATLQKRKSDVDKMVSVADKSKCLTRFSSGQLAGVGKISICCHTRDAIKRNLHIDENKANQLKIKREQ
jgi:hypothetical protein